MAAEDLYQTASLIDQFKHDDINVRVNSSSQLIRIASALGPERTRTELIPFLEETTDDDDEVLVVTAAKLGELVNYVGGREHVNCLLGPLELLAMIDEQSVRKATLLAVEAVANAMSDADLEKHYMPFVLKMATKEWYTARLTATGLFHFAYKRLDEGSHRSFRSTFLRLCMDDSPVVRRHTMMYIGKLAAVVTQEEVVKEFMGVFTSIAGDEHDSVRVQVITACAQLGQLVPQDVGATQILPVVLSLSNDKAWRVRWTLANELPGIAAGLGAEITNDSLASAFEALLNDAEAEVRGAAASNISKMCAQLKKEKIVGRILAATQRIVTDSSEGARAALAGGINAVATILGRSDTVTHLLPMLLLLLRDETSEVRLGVISNLAAINEVVGIDLLAQSLLPAIIDLSEDSKWRVRLAIIEYIPRLAEQLGKEFFDEKLSELCMNWLADEVYSVRRAAADNVRKLVDSFGEEWATERIVPHVEKLKDNINYLQRMTGLYCIQTLISSCMSGEGVKQHLLPVLLDMEKDKVPNVRFTVARTLSALFLRLKSDAGAQGSSPEWESEVVASLRRLIKDEDRDVRRFTKESLDSLAL